MLYDIQIGNQNFKWNEEIVREKLERISHLNRKTAWIQKDLSAPNSSAIARFFWSVIVKYVQWMRDLFYRIDLEQSKKVLLQIHQQINTQNRDLLKLFHAAIGQFNQISRTHHVDVATDHKSISLVLPDPEQTPPGQEENSEAIERLRKEIAGLESEIVKMEAQEAAAKMAEQRNKTADMEAADVEEEKNAAEKEREADFAKMRAETLRKIEKRYAASPAKIKAVKELVSEYVGRWNPDLAAYRIEAYDLERFISTLHTCVTKFAPDCDYRENYGFIEKKELLENSYIGTHADFHGDLKSLVELLNMFQKHGLLDANFKCRPQTTLVFLGDYPDRGEHSLPVMELLACLKMENPDQVVLIRGNHEDVDLNMNFASPEVEPAYAQFLDSNARDFRLRSKLLEAFYQTMPLTAYLGQKMETGRKHFAQFTHGLFELTTDPASILQDPNSCIRACVPIKRVMSSRIQAIETDPTEDYMAQISSASKSERKRLKWMHSIRRVQELIWLDRNREDAASLTTYNWGDVAGDLKASKLGNPGYRKWKLTAEDIKHYYRACSTPKAKVNFGLRGHQHLHDHHLFHGKVAVTTLPVGKDSLGYKDIFNEKGRAYIIQISGQFKNWVKWAITRSPGKESDPDLTPGYSLLSDAI